MSDAEIIFYTDVFDENAVQAVGKEKNFLALRRLRGDFERFDGEEAQYVLDYRWLSRTCEHENDGAWVHAQGTEESYWTEEEIEDLGGIDALERGDKTLFDYFNLF